MGAKLVCDSADFTDVDLAAAPTWLDAGCVEFAIFGGGGNVAALFCEFRVCPFRYAGSVIATFSSCCTTGLMPSGE